LAINRHVR
jgi:hypothetical protein